MRLVRCLLAGLLALSITAAAQDLPKVTVGMSGWTGFAPLSLAEKAGIFKKNGIPRSPSPWPSPPPGERVSKQLPRPRRGRGPG